MRFNDWLRWVFRAVLSNRARSWLTALGIAIGITAVALLTAIGEGVRLYMLDSFSQFGTNILAVNPGRSLTQGMGGMISTVRPLSLDDAQSLRRLPFVQQVVPSVTGNGRVEAGEYARSTIIIGCNHEADEAWAFPVAAGRFLPNDDLYNPRYFAVLGHKLKQELFGHRNALGEFVRVDGTRFRVVGVMEAKGQMLGFDLDDMIFIPIYRAMQLFNREGLMEINVVYRPGIGGEAISERVRQQLIERHGEEDFTLTTQEDMLASLDNILSMLKVAIGALGGISLLVGGVGVLTIMTTALVERTPEIGLLRAIGTTRRHILLLFLGEAIFLAVLGGLLGLVILAVLVLLLALAVPELPVTVQPMYLLMALALSALVGLFAGIAPAQRAARLNPIEALRAE